jgi:hypothetical protein
MDFQQHRFGFRIIASAIALLCVVAASVMIQVRASNGLVTKKPSVELRASQTLITIPCPPNSRSRSGSCSAELDRRVGLTTLARDFNKQAVYKYSVTVGRVIGEGSEVVWDLTGVWPGNHAAAVEVQDNKGHRAASSLIVKMVNCADCLICDGLCPTVSVTCYEVVKAGTPITCKVMVVGSESTRLTYEWSARDSRGEDLSARMKGSGEYVSIPTRDLAGRTIYTSVEVKELDPSCNRTASASTVVKP